MKNSQRQVKMLHPSSKTLQNKPQQATLVPLKFSGPHQQRQRAAKPCQTPSAVFLPQNSYCSMEKSKNHFQHPPST